MLNELFATAASGDGAEKYCVLAGMRTAMSGHNKREGGENL